MLYFRDFSLRVTPSPKIFLTNPRDESDFGLNLDLDISAPVSCWIRPTDDEMSPITLDKVDLDKQHCGIVAIDEEKSYCHLTVLISMTQFNLFISAMSAVGPKLKNVTVDLLLDPRCVVFPNRRVYRIEKEPYIWLSTLEAK